MSEEKSENIIENTTIVRIKERTKNMLKELKKRKSMTTVEAAVLSNYSLSYFTTFILNVLKMLYKDCLLVSRGRITWVCEDNKEP
ncbi:MAG: hypothetical protein QXK24_00655 [Ignisphaera sp.]|uniref:Uncharacterized protein n=1 Tax=Ignisphaera aggregans TaxID=334771 RepID=A0A7C4D095_9CREN